jgi:hypothetical protein
MAAAAHRLAIYMLNAAAPHGMHYLITTDVSTDHHVPSEN